MDDKIYNSDDFLARWLSNELTPEELSEFESHPDFADFKRIADTSANFATPKWQDKNEAWQSFQQKAQQSTKQHEAVVKPIISAKDKAKARSRRTMRIAAGLLLLVGAFAITRWITGNNEGFVADTTVSTTNAARKSVMLPDGSTVRLNASSTLAYNEKEFLKDRHLELKGEAFFEVEKGATFWVETHNGSVQVLGTSFNVSARKQTLDVTCYTGKVGVFFENRKDMNILLPTDRIIAEGKKIITKQTTTETESPSWSKGQSKFSKANIQDVFDEMERQFDVKISYPESVANIQDFNGGFPHNNLETALQIVTSTIGYRFEIEGQQVNIFK